MTTPSVMAAVMAAAQGQPRHWAESYIGLPWSATGEGPEAFHCWAFVCHVQDRHFGRGLPTIPNPENLHVLARRFRDHPERRRWTRVEIPAEGDCVLLRQARVPIHVGVWLAVDGGGVLHCAEEAGVVFHNPPALALNGWHIEGFYRFSGDGPCWPR